MYQDNYEAAKLLLRSKANDDDEGSAMKKAISTGDKRMTQLLLDYQ